MEFRAHRHRESDKHLAHDLHAATPPVAPPFEWTQLAGAATGLLDGVDAQAWVRESRLASDEARARRIDRKP